MLLDGSPQSFNIDDSTAGERRGIQNLPGQLLALIRMIMLCLVVFSLAKFAGGDAQSEAWLIDDPEFTSVCPKTGLPDFGRITIRYMPRDLCLELKSLKEYLFTYRDLGIFQENIVNQVLEDVVKACDPVWAKVVGDFRPRGGISTIVEAVHPRPTDPKPPRT